MCNVHRDESSNVSPSLTSNYTDVIFLHGSSLIIIFYSQGRNTGLHFLSVFVATVNDYVQYLFIGCVTLSGGVW